MSNPAGGYLLVSPGTAGTAANFSMPLVNLASPASVNSSQPAIPSKFDLKTVPVCISVGPSLSLSLSLSFSISLLKFIS